MEGDSPGAAAPEERKPQNLRPGSENTRTARRRRRADVRLGSGVSASAKMIGHHYAFASSGLEVSDRVMGFRPKAWSSVMDPKPYFETVASDGGGGGQQ